MPDTLEEMEPLFLAVRHGCGAGLHQEAINEVYWKRINRNGKAYSEKFLGAFGLNLSTLSYFYLSTWSVISKELTEINNAIILGWAGYNYKSIAKLPESVSTLKKSLKIHLEQNNLLEACKISHLLSESLLESGDLKTAAKFAITSVEFAEKTNSMDSVIDSLANYAHIVHQLGKLKKAKKLFFKAELNQKSSEPEYNYLYSIRGYRYSDLLIDLEQFNEVANRVKLTSDWTRNYHSFLDTAINSLIFGRILHCFSLNLYSDEILKRTLEHLDESISILKKGGRLDYLPKALLARATYHRHHRNWQAAEEDLEEVLDIAEPSGMRLHLTDYHLETARLRLAQARPADARPHVAEAARLIEETGYHRRDKELAELQKALGE
ncbi:MAG: hypothetical protein IPN76_00760 [Saprospiraceae bacterium]|nr:hypothetical protein [Saprospiraceae bacterium]